MEMIKRFEPITLLIVVLGALNWGMVGLFDTNVISDVFGTGTTTDVVYTIVGACGRRNAATDRATCPLRLDVAIAHGRPRSPRLSKRSRVPGSGRGSRLSCP